jgi:hypothetical protein
MFEPTWPDPININNKIRKDKNMANAENKKEQTAAQAYQNAKFDIASLLDRIGQELEQTPEKLHWGHAGDMMHLRQNLIEALSEMTGFTEDAIRETLEDIRTDAQNQK